MSRMDRRPRVVELLLVALAMSAGMTALSFAAMRLVGRAATSTDTREECQA